MSKRLMSINVHYSPRSFGGATIVAEEVNKILVQDHDWTVCVVTTEHNRDLLPYQVSRYRSKEVTVISINRPGQISKEDELGHGRMARVIEEVVTVFMPDVVHMHSIQTMGVDFISSLNQKGISTLATLHDCWWICERQFMINKNGKYCFQDTIEKNVCMHCVDDKAFFDRRWDKLRHVLTEIDTLLFPSEFHKGVHLMNGLDPEKCVVNKNGVKFPKENFKRKSSKYVRFGFIGGPGFIKGGDLIKDVFEDLEGDFKLFLVDAAQNVGQSWAHDFKSTLKNKNVEMIDAYDQEGLDNFFGSIDVLLFPSQWKESFGLTVREAMIRDVWVISTSSGGTIEDMRDGENATIIPLSNDTQYLEAAVKNCMERDWSDYKNPHKADIKSYVDQAIELNDQFMKLIAPKQEVES